MKVFISWSGDVSKQVALLLKDWLQSVVQSVKPWVSSDDIERGSVWFNDIGNALADVNIGIVVLTEENKNKPWILFESGALAKGLTTNRVCTFLVDLKPSDILQNPLSNFNHTEPTKDGLFKLIETINNNQENKLNDKVLHISFDTFYPQFAKQFATILSSSTVVEKKEIKQPDLLKEVLQVVRNIEKRMADIGNEIPTEQDDYSRLKKVLVKYKSNKQRPDFSLPYEEFIQTLKEDDNYKP